MSNRLISVLRQIGPKLALRGAILIVLLISAGLLVNRYEFGEIAETLNFSADARAGWLNGRVAFLVLAALFTAAGGPRQVMSFFAAYFFGLATGFWLALAGTIAGCALALSLATIFGSFARNLIRGRVDVAVRLWAENAFAVTLLLRLLPAGSNLVTNLAAGVTRVPVPGFLAGSALGYMPQTLVFALMGSGVNVGSESQIALSIVLFVLSALIGVWIYARYRKRISRSKTPAEAG